MTSQSQALGCVDPLKSCTGPKHGKMDLRDEGRRLDQTMDGQAQERAGVGNHLREDDCGRSQPALWAGRDRWASLALVIDCHTGELLASHLSRTGRATTAASALEQALIARFGTLGAVPNPFLLRFDNGLVFPAATTQPWSEAMGCARSLSSRTAHSKTAWLNA